MPYSTNYTEYRLQRFRLRLAFGYNKQIFFASKSLSVLKNFGNTGYLLATSNFLCIFLLVVSETKCAWICCSEKIEIEDRQIGGVGHITRKHLRVFSIFCWCVGKYSISDEPVAAPRGFVLSKQLPHNCINFAQVISK